jgi:hypothetical protein
MGRFARGCKAFSSVFVQLDVTHEGYSRQKVQHSDADLGDVLIAGGGQKVGACVPCKRTIKGCKLLRPSTLRTTMALPATHRSHCANPSSLAALQQTDGCGAAGSCCRDRQQAAWCMYCKQSVRMEPDTPNDSKLDLPASARKLTPAAPYTKQDG